MAIPGTVDVVQRDSDDRDYVNSLARGLMVIRAFNRSRPSMTLSEVAKRTGINRAAARRFLLTLVREGYAETDGKYFRLRPKILELGFSALSSITFAEIAQPVMDELADELDEMCLAAVLDGEWCVYVNRTTTQRVISVNLDVGSRLPAYCMSTGRVLLAALDDDALDSFLAELRPERYTSKTIVSKRKLREVILQARRDGWTVMDEEYEIGFRSLSVPIRDRAGRTIAALNVCCPTPRVSLKTMKTEFLPLTLRAAEEIRESLPEGVVRSARDLLPRS
ncbi:MAG TPA: IclR family transcriptional regulator C-terminal domain-containing protein [Gaiellaceae bacterium]